MAKAIYGDSKFVNKVNNDFLRIILRSINKYSCSLDTILNNKDITDYISDEYKNAVKSFSYNSNFKEITGCTNYEVILACLEANITKFAYEFGPCDFYENMMDEIAKEKEERKASENKMSFSSDIQKKEIKTSNVEETKVEISEPERSEVNEVEIKEEPNINEVKLEDGNESEQPTISEELIEDNKEESDVPSISVEETPEEKEISDIDKADHGIKESEEVIEGYETGEAPMEVIDQIASTIDDSKEDVIEDIPVPVDPENSYEASSYYDELEEERKKSEVKPEPIDKKRNEIPKEENEGIPFFKDDEPSEKENVVHEHNQFMPFGFNKDEEKIPEENKPGDTEPEKENKLDGFILDNLLETEPVHEEPKPVMEPPHEEPHREIKVEDIPFFSRRMNQ